MASSVSVSVCEVSTAAGKVKVNAPKNKIGHRMVGGKRLVFCTYPGCNRNRDLLLKENQTVEQAVKWLQHTPAWKFHYRSHLKKALAKNPEKIADRSGGPIPLPSGGDVSVIYFITTVCDFFLFYVQYVFFSFIVQL